MGAHSYACFSVLRISASMVVDARDVRTKTEKSRERSLKTWKRSGVSRGVRGQSAILQFADDTNNR
jgi:hypothetical protein